MVNHASKLLIWCVPALAVIVVCIIWPPFTILSLQAVREAEEQAAFDPKGFAQALWTNDFLSLAVSAPDISDLLRALERNVEDAAEQYGRVWGLGGNTYFMCQGVGRVVAVHDDRLEITINGIAAGPDIVLLTDHIYGNTVRNASGLIDPSEFPNSQDLNNLSAALNAIVMNDVLPELREAAAVDARVRFLGCVEIRTADSISKIEMVPISAGVVSDEEASSP